MQHLSLKERQRQVREDAILDAARDLLNEQGYADMSMDDLAARVGVSKATLYQHFPSKEELAIHVITSAMQRGVSEMDTLDPSLPAVDRLRAALFSSIRGRAGMWSAQVVLPSHVIRHPAFCAHRAKVIDRLSTLVDEAKAQHDIRADIPTEVIVHSLMMFYRMDFKELLLDGTLTADDVSRQIVSLALDGLRTSSLGTTPNNIP